MAREREVDLSERMSEHEALMWNVEKDPWLNPNGASLTLLDQPVDAERFMRQLRASIAKMPRLYQRVVPGLGRLSTPAWAPDPEFDLAYHVRQVELPGTGDRRELFDLATLLYEEPLDRTRPLWRFVLISGLEDGGGAIYAMIHHVISDGIGQLRMAEMYQQLTRDEPGPDDVDIDAVIAEAVAASRSKESGGDIGSSLVDTARDTFGHVARRQIGIARRVAGEVVLWPADPERATERVSTLAETVKSTVGQIQSLRGGDDDDGPRHGSPLWTERSRHRHLEHVRVPVEDLKQAGKFVGGSLNDAFLAGLAEAAYRYHADRDTPVHSFNSSFVLSTRTNDKIGGNAFTPVPVRLPGGPMDVVDRLREVTQVTEGAKDEAQRTGGIGGLSGVLNLLPTSVVTRAARGAAAHIDFATSNLRGAPFELYCAGAQVQATICMGPVAGTGANITALSHDGNFDIGVFVDPAAITDPASFRVNIEEAFADLFAATAPKKKKARRRSTTAAATEETREKAGADA